jgi:putative FmdB family regulatory protein
MPLFDFRCRSCEHVFEALIRPGHATPLCPACQGVDLEKLLATFAVSSAERTQAAASVARNKAAKTARQDNVAMDKEIMAHRKEDHGH